MTKNLKGRNSVENNIVSIRTPHAHFHVHKIHARFENDSLKTVEEVDYSNSIPYNVKSYQK